MIYEVRTYDLKPRAIPQAEEAFAGALASQGEIRPIAAFWHTEIGPLNQIIQFGLMRILRSAIRFGLLQGKIPIGRQRSPLVTP
ncbi:MAG: hypothetical protein Ct9H300mP11_26320 [Chloroflexota bacterium]|nr:MAG: hypothetical protein Ct9H300mP11_26320 [Chloroflexota bacterium]